MLMNDSVSPDAGLPQVKSERLYTVVDGTLPYGRKAAQAIHAVAEYALDQPEAFRQWHDNGNYVILLEVPTSDSLYRLYHDALQAGFVLKTFYEPDFGDRMTAFTLTPHPELPEFLSQLPSASKHMSLGQKLKCFFRRG